MQDYLQGILIALKGAPVTLSVSAVAVIAGLTEPRNVPERSEGISSQLQLRFHCLSRRREQARRRKQRKRL